MMTGEYTVCYHIETHFISEIILKVIILESGLGQCATYALMSRCTLS